MSISEHEAKTLADFEAYEAEVATLRARVAELGVELDAARRVIETNGQLVSHEARALEAERDLEAARGLIARLGDADALESLNALLTLERANHLSARARVVELERERDEAADEAAACVEFLRNLRDWHSFWEEGFLGEKTASASRQNGQALRAFLDETGHARRVVERLASLERDLEAARGLISRLGDADALESLNALLTAGALGEVTP